MRTRILSAALAAVVSFSAFAAFGVSAEDAVIELKPKKNIEDINSKWTQLKPVFNDNLYVEEALVYSYDADSFKAGKVADGAKKDGVNMINFARYLADIPSDVYLDKDYCTYAQYGSALLLCEGKLNHTPEQPVFMPDDFYKTGYKGTSEGNIYSQPTAYHPNQIISDSIQGYLSDSSSNISTLGHRRWILNPNMGATGLGAAADSWTGQGYSVMYAFDKSRSAKAYDCVTWPSVGYHPTNMFGDNYPWSVSLNRSVFDASNTEDIQVSMHISLANGGEKDITLTSADKDKSGKYFNVSTANYGSGFCIIFRPEWTYKNGDRVDVTISGVYKNGESAPSTIKYSTEFFKIGGKSASSPTASNEDKILSDKNAISDAVKSMQVTNSTTKEQFLADAMKNVKYGTVGEWGVDYSKTDATEQKDGLIKGTINLELDGVYQAVKVSKSIQKISDNAQPSAEPAPTKKPAPTAKPKTDKKPSKSKFKDVAADAYYAEAVDWAVEKNITAGTSKNKFSPDDTCNRAQILTFLHRAVGAPEMEGGSPFTDISDSGDYYYYHSALWAYGKGMVTDLEFAADTSCTRASTVMYLWQNAGAPDVSADTAFTDVPSDAYYAKAVAWAVQNGVTSGTSATEFSPDDICSRGQIVTFLHRALK